MHVHIATHKLPEHANYKGVKVKAWQLGTKIWRDIVGENNGLCFVGGQTKNGGHRRNLSLGKMAAYVSKYILKDYEESPEEKNRYSRSNGTVVPKSKVMYFNDMSMTDIIALCFECRDGDSIVSHHVDATNGAYWLCTEPAPDIVYH